MSVVLTRQVTVAGTGYAGAFSKTLNILPGTLDIKDKDDHRGGTFGLPRVKVSVGAEGSFQALVCASSETLTNYAKLSDFVGYVSTIGEGGVTVTDVTSGDILAKDALLDVEITGKAVQIANVTWKGTNYTA